MTYHKTLIFFALFAMIYMALNAADDTHTIAVSVQHTGQTKKMSFLVSLINRTPLIEQFAKLIKGMLEQTQWQKSGFTIDITYEQGSPHVSMVKKYSGEYDLALFLNPGVDNAIEWRLYDVRQAIMIKGGKGIVNTDMMLCQAEQLADELSYILTGQKSFFTSRIAFCRNVRAQGKSYKQLWVIPPYQVWSARTTEESSMLTQGYNIFAPRWNKDPYMPLLFYSQATNSNVRLVSINLRKQRRVVSNLTGMTMQPSFSHDNREVIYCVTHDGKLQLYRYTAQNAEMPSLVRPFITNAGNNFSPQLCANGDVIFCSDEITKTPHICWYHATNGTIEIITPDGYNVCPTLCEQNGMLAYCKRMHGYTQLFFYSVAQKQHEQITFDATNKDECSWSPCGTYIAFTVDDGNNSRIALLNRITKERVWLTPADEQCTYPCWSGMYKVPLRI